MSRSKYEWIIIYYNFAIDTVVASTVDEALGMIEHRRDDVIVAMRGRCND